MQFRRLAINLCFTVILPLITVNVLQARGMGVVPALAWSAVFPALETVATWLRSRHLDALGAISLTFIVLGVGASLLSGDAHFALAKESAFTAIFGLLCLGSLASPRPLMFFISRTFATAGDPVREAEWNDRWKFPYFRHVIRTMTVVWGAGYVSEAAVRIVLVYILPVKVAIFASPILATVVTVLLVAWTMRYSRAAERRGMEMRAQAALAAQGAVKVGS